jgi:hypothetical protein
MSDPIFEVKRKIIFFSGGGVFFCHPDGIPPFAGPKVKRKPSLLGQAEA